MPKSYDLAPQSVTDLIASVSEQFHNSLLDADVKIGVIMVFAPVDEETGIRKGTALTGHAGAPAAAQVKLVSVKDRLTKKYDVEMLIDGDHWKEITEEMQIAIIDHELTHIERTGEVDDGGRPKLKMRDEDFIVWGFLDVVRRHGAAAMEAMSLRKLIKEHGSLLLGTEIPLIALPEPKLVIVKSEDIDDDDEDTGEADEADEPVTKKGKRG